MLDQTMTASKPLANSQPLFRHEIFVGNRIMRLREKGLSSLEHAMMQHPNALGIIVGQEQNTIQHCVRNHKFSHVKAIVGGWSDSKQIQLINDARIHISTLESPRFLAGEYRYIYVDKIEDFNTKAWEHVVSRVNFRNFDDCCVYASCYTEALDELPMWIHKLIEAEKYEYSQQLLHNRG